MPAHQSTEPRLAPELEGVATAAAELLRARAVDDTLDRDTLQTRLREAATAAIAAGAELDAIAHAQRIGQERARHELGTELLRRVERGARRRREIETEYHDAVIRAAQLGLAHRDIAAAASIAPGTVRAVLGRTKEATRSNETRPAAATENNVYAEHPRA
jgi:hypothetical protein